MHSKSSNPPHGVLKDSRTTLHTICSLSLYLHAEWCRRTSSQDFVQLVAVPYWTLKNDTIVTTLSRLLFMLL